MNYKTITLHLLEQNRQLHDRLRSQHMLLPTMERHAMELKERHEFLKVFLSQNNHNEDQNANEAMEIAVKELENRLSSDNLPTIETVHLPPA